LMFSFKKKKLFSSILKHTVKRVLLPQQIILLLNQMVNTSLLSVSLKMIQLSLMISRRINK
jgi:hypothetical protein